MTACSVFTPGARRYWCFAVVYSGDSVYASSSERSVKECFSVVAGASTTVTRPGIKTTTQGKGNLDVAVVKGSLSAAPKGTVSFYECGPKVKPKTCTAGTLFDAKKLKGTNPAFVLSTTFVANKPGYWCFAAVYSGDSIYPGSSDTSTHECFFVTPLNRPGSSGGGGRQYR